MENGLNLLVCQYCGDNNWAEETTLLVCNRCGTVISKEFFKSYTGVSYSEYKKLISSKASLPENLEDT